MTRAPLTLAAFASLIGAAGVVLAAAAAHAGGGGLAETGALFLILHAAALLGLAALVVQVAGTWRRALIVCGFALGFAALLFSGDLAARALAGARLFPFAAPIGGTGMIALWLAVAGIFTTAAIQRR